MVCNFWRNCCFLMLFFVSEKNVWSIAGILTCFTVHIYWIGQSVVFVIVEKANNWVLFLARI